RLPNCWASCCCAQSDNSAPKRCSTNCSRRSDRRVSAANHAATRWRCARSSTTFLTTQEALRSSWIRNRSSTSATTSAMSSASTSVGIGISVKQYDHEDTGRGEHLRADLVGMRVQECVRLFAGHVRLHLQHVFAVDLCRDYRGIECAGKCRDFLSRQI